MPEHEGMLGAVSGGGFGGRRGWRLGRALFVRTCGSIGGGTGETMPGDTPPLPGCGEATADSAFTGGGSISPNEPEVLMPARGVVPFEDLTSAEDTTGVPLETEAIGDGSDGSDGEVSHIGLLPCCGDKNCCEKAFAGWGKAHEDDGVGDGRGTCIGLETELAPRERA